MGDTKLTESTAMDEGSNGDIPSMAEDTNKREGMATDPPET
jgi:hypothetical protein